MLGPGILGDLFDFDNDGRMDLFEEATELKFLHDTIDADEKEDDRIWTEDREDEEDSED